MSSPEIGGLFGYGDYASETPRAGPFPDQTGEAAGSESNPDDPELYWALFDERHRPEELDLPPSLNESA